MPAAFASRMTLRDASLTAGISSAGTSIAGAGKETRYFVIVQISVCASVSGGGLTSRIFINRRLESHFSVRHHFQEAWILPDGIKIRIRLGVVQQADRDVLEQRL